MSKFSPHFLTFLSFFCSPESGICPLPFHRNFSFLTNPMASYESPPPSSGDFDITDLWWSSLLSVSSFYIFSECYPLFSQLLYNYILKGPSWASSLFIFFLSEASNPVPLITMKKSISVIGITLIFLPPQLT